MDNALLYILVGVLCGVFSAMFGVGSGIIMIPALVLLFHFPQKTAQGTCLAAMVPMALAGAIRYKMNAAIPVDLRVVGWIALGGVAGAVIGAYIAGVLSGPLLRKMFAVVMIVAAVRMLLVPAPGPTQAPPTPPSAATQSTE